jgi:hypothetical protein
LLQVHGNAGHESFNLGAVAAAADVQQGVAIGDGEFLEPG